MGDHCITCNYNVACGMTILSENDITELGCSSISLRAKNAVFSLNKASEEQLGSLINSTLAFSPVLTFEARFFFFF